LVAGRAAASIASLHTPCGGASASKSAALVDAENDRWTVTVASGPEFSVTAEVVHAFNTPLRCKIYFVRDVLLAAEPDQP